jgi:hypothetical protein
VWDRIDAGAVPSPTFNGGIGIKQARRPRLGSDQRVDAGNSYRQIAEKSDLQAPGKRPVVDI